MPTYSYQCEDCKKEWEATHTVADRYEETCCGTKATLLIVPKSMFFHMFTPHTYQDICETPIHVTSKNQLKELCKVHDVRVARLE